MTISRVLASVALTAMLSCGTNGSNGTPGPTGLSGPEGPAGPMGSTGDKGDQGDKGDKGDKGDTGMTGANGPSTGDIPLPGSGFYPESLTALANGTLFIGSIINGEVWKFVPGAQIPTKFLAADAAHKNVAGLLADETNGFLYIIANDISDNTKGAVLRYKLADGTLDKTYAVGAASAINDLAFDGTGNLFVTDAIGAIYKLPAGGTALAKWSSDTKLASATPGRYGADGIAFDGTSNLFVTNIEDGKLLRIAINAGDGSAGAVDEIVVTPPIARPDGLRFVNATTYLVTENLVAGKLTSMVVDNAAKTAASTVISNRLDYPTSVVKIGAVYWITEGQISRFFDGMAPNLPFYVRRLPAFN